MLIHGNSIKIPLADNSISCAVTSPPYWNLRDYNIVGQIGLESTIGAYVAVMVQVFREIKRVLHPSGVAWVNLGDTYATSRNGRSAADGKATGNDDRTFRDKPFAVNEIPAKNLCLIPERIAIALQDDGWYVRSIAPWVKRNAMPSSVQDRPGTAHEVILMLTKEPRYYFDMEAVRRPGSPNSESRYRYDFTGRPGLIMPNGDKQRIAPEGRREYSPGRAIRTSDFFFDSLDAYIHHLETVRDKGGMMLDEDGTPAAFAVNPRGYRFAHYATYPVELVVPMIKCSTSERGHCPKCGKGWIRIVERKFRPMTDRRPEKLARGSGKKGIDSWRNDSDTPRGSLSTQTLGWRPSCNCNAGEPIPAIILDPFCGSGAAGEAARELGRRFIGIDLSAKYLQENALPRSEKMTSESAIKSLPLFQLIEK